VASNHASVNRLQVRVGSHRRGIGSALLRITLDRSTGSLRRYTSARNASARCFCEGRGFTAVAFGFAPMWQPGAVRREWRRSQ
jgi:GNAT superfamily N-acetyltransferase